MKTYAVKEIYHTLQGEGAHAGQAAVFCRFAGCNLWSGHEKDRASAICQFCDTQFADTNGVNGGTYDDVGLKGQLNDRWVAETPDVYHKFVVFTGGEPALQLDSDLIDSLKQDGWAIAVETNGTKELPSGIDWITVSPKAGTEIKQAWGNELKLVYPQNELLPDDPAIQGIGNYFEHRYLQPMDGPNLAENTSKAIRFCQENPAWKLSVQVHKMIGIE